MLAIKRGEPPVELTKTYVSFFRSRGSTRTSLR